MSPTLSDPLPNTTAGLADPTQPEQSAFGLSMAALMMTIFGFIWLGWAFSVSAAFTDFSSGSFLPASRWIRFYIAFLLLLGISIQALRRARSAMKAAVATPDNFRSRYRKPFGRICLFEGAGCALAVALTVGFHRVELLAAGISLVVGLHFLPLARVFRYRAYYVAGAAIILCDLLALDRLRGNAITLGSGVATGTILWLAAVYALLDARKFLQPGTH